MGFKVLGFEGWGVGFRAIARICNVGLGVQGRSAEVPVPIVSSGAAGK